jgi:hypothetical protein
VIGATPATPTHARSMQNIASSYVIGAHLDAIETADSGAMATPFK